MPRRALQSAGITLALCLLAQPAAAQQAALPQPEPGPASPPTGDAPPPVGSEQPAQPSVATPLSEDELAPTGERTVYTPADFTRFAPRNAYEMLLNVPGFKVEQEAEERGLGQASGNVLINGQRLTSKNDTTQSQLTRVPSANVIRIELVDGSTLNIPGLSGQVANVIARSGGGAPSGRFEWRPQWQSGGAPLRYGQGDASISGKTGALDYAFAVRNDAFYGGGSGPNIIYDGAGILDERFSRSWLKNDQLKASATFKYDLGNQARANLNLSGGYSIFRQEETEVRVPRSPLATFDELIGADNTSYTYEINGDVEFALGPGRLKLIGLESYDRGDNLSFSRLAIASLTATGTQFVRGSDAGERIGRGEYRWRLWGADWQLSLEAAFNRLTNVSELFRLDASGAYVPLPFPAATGGVQESRYEGILSYARPLTANLSLQLALGGELSTISQTGVDALSRTFKRPKGSLSLAWAPSSNLDVSLRLARRVGQLTFGDFLASVNLNENNSNAGNNQLRPPQSWELELDAAHDFGAWGSATVKLYHHLIEDYVTIIPVLAGGEARGNIDSARNSGISANGTLRLDQLGMPGAKIDVRGLIERSSLVDPVTGIARAFDRARASEITIDYRHDVPGTDWAYGASFRDTDYLPYYRVAEEGLDTMMLPRFAAAFVEHKDVLGLKVNLRLGNLLNDANLLNRAVYLGPRNVAPLSYREFRIRKSGIQVGLTVSGTF